MAANEGVTKAIAGFYRDDLGMVFLGLSYYLNVPILYLPTYVFWVFTLSLPKDFRKRSGYFRRSPTTFRRLPNVAEMFANVSKTFKHSEAT